MATRPIETVLAEHTPALMAMPGVVGTYQGALEDGRPCIGVLLLYGHPETRSRIPEELEGHPVRIHETDPIRPMGGDST